MPMKPPTDAPYLYDAEEIFRIEIATRQVKLLPHPGPRNASAPTSLLAPEDLIHPSTVVFSPDALLALLSQHQSALLELPAGPARRASLRRRLLSSPAGRALLMPYSLQKPRERYFSHVMTALAEPSDAGNAPHFLICGLLLHPSHLMQLYHMSNEAWAQSVPVNDVVNCLSSLTD